MKPARCALGAALAAMILAAWGAPVWAQEHAPAGSAPAAANAPSANTPAGSSVESPAERGSSQGMQEPGPGGLGAPQGGGREVGAQHERGAAEHGQKEEEEEEGISIHFPSLVYWPLKQLWFKGPATLNADGAVTADGAPVTAAALKGKKVDFEYVDHHSTQHPKPRIPVQAEIGSIGTAKPGPGAKTETVSVDGREIILVNPAADFALEHMLPEHLVLSLITALCVALCAFLLTRNLQRVPNKTQTLVEMIYSGLDSFVEGLIGPTYKKYVPLIATGFIYILFMNLVGLVPAWASPTANINVTAGLAIVIVVYVQIEGIRANGFKGYLKHFWGEPWWLGPLNFPIHVVGELARVLSLTMRLFGNIFGEDVVIVILIILAGMFTRGFVPVQAPMYVLAIFTSLVQALVFSILTGVYIALATTHEDHGHAEHGHEEHGRHGAAIDLAEAAPRPAV